MSWWEYVERIAKTARQRDITDQTGIDATEVTRWRRDGKIPSPLNVAEFARGYDRPVLEAFVAADFLTEAEAKVRPAAAPDLTKLTNDELLEEVHARMREEGELGGNAAAIDGPPEIGPQGRRRGTPATPVARAARKQPAKK